MPTTVSERESVAIHEFPPIAASVPAARAVTCEFAAAVMSEAQRRSLGLAITEVIANAIRYSGSDDHIKLILTRKDSYLCARVIDGGRGLVPQPGAMSSEPGAGFGLFLVEKLTRRWGMTREDGRTRVWFELDYEDGARALEVSDAPCDPV